MKSQNYTTPELNVTELVFTTVIAQSGTAAGNLRINNVDIEDGQWEL